MSINLYIFNESRRGGMFGIGTYIQELCRVYSIQNLREKAFITGEGVSMLGISEAAEAIGFRTSGVRITMDELEKECSQPCILHWNQ